MKIDPYRMWRMLEERIATETNPLHRRQLETIVKHMKGESMGDIDFILTTVSPDATYYHFNTPGAPPRVFHGHDGIRGFYDEMLATVSVNTEMCVERLVVDDYCVVTEGPMRSAVRGTALKAAGLEVDDLDAFYFSEGQALVVWPFDPESGLILGERIYTVPGMTLDETARQKLAPEEIGTYAKAA
jgi:hypothetical protein